MVTGDIDPSPIRMIDVMLRAGTTVILLNSARTFFRPTGGHVADPGLRLFRTGR